MDVFFMDPDFSERIRIFGRSGSGLRKKVRSGSETLTITPSPSHQPTPPHKYIQNRLHCVIFLLLHNSHAKTC